jgi:cytosine deaminase
MAWQSINPRESLERMVKTRGGWVNAHAHIDRSFIINEDNWHLTADTLEQKWDYVDQFKRESSVADIERHMARVVELMLEQGAQALGSFIDCDTVVRDKALQAAQRIKDRYGKQIKLRFIHQPIKGLMDKSERQWFEEAASFVDIIGGLPERDSKIRLPEDHRADHLDLLFEAGKKHGKPLHVHIDQMNAPEQRDTELLIEKTREHGYKGKVAAVHGLSIAAQPQERRQEIYRGLVEQDITMIACPTGWIDARRNETQAPTHSAVTPVDEMLPAGVRVALGTDNIADIYKPFVDGNLWTELRFLLEATHTYDVRALANIASTNGLRALWLD